MDSERFYNQPTFSEDKQTTKCENCQGEGFIYCYDSDDVNDRQLMKEECQHCDGDGYIYIND